MAKRTGPFWDGVEGRLYILAVVDAALADPSGETIAIATATARVIPLKAARVAV